jgi:hypothetical protein
MTKLVTPDDPAALNAWFDDLEEGLGRYGGDEPRAAPEGGERIVGFDLTTHEGHRHNRLVLLAHEIAGRDAQHAFRGEGNVERLSMLHQLAKHVAS